jgi:hypothetical protein
MKRFILFFILLTLLPNFLKAQESLLGDSLMAFNAGILTPTPDRILRGVEFVDGYFYVTGSDPDDNWTQKIYKFSSDGQSLLDYWVYEDVLASWGDMAYDGEFLYVTDIQQIRQIDISNGELTGVTISAPQYYNSGLAYDATTDHFWISGDDQIIYEVDRQGNVVNSVSFIPDLPSAGLAWDIWSAGGPFLWVWSMKYTPSDVRPKAFQMNPENGTLTNVTFEGMLLNPDAPYGADYSGGMCMSDEFAEDKVALIGIHASSYQQTNDQLDWVAVYDIDPNGTGVPGPIISYSPSFIDNDLVPYDSMDVSISIINNDIQYNLDWYAFLEYPALADSVGLLGDTMQVFDLSALTSDFNTHFRGLAFIGEHIYASTGINWDDQFELLKISKDGSEIVQSWTFYSAFNGWQSITADDQYIYGMQQYQINRFDPQTGTVSESYYSTNFSADGLAYDPQQEHFFMGNGVGAIKEINKFGDEINFFVVPYEIEGLSWDSWSPGGPFLWVYYTSNDGLPKASRLDPNTGLTTGVEFDGIDLSISNDYIDQANDIMVTPDWQNDRLVMLALHNSETEWVEGADQIITYDLATIPPPGWIDLIGTAYGSNNPLEEVSFDLRLRAVGDDTLMTALVVINSNDVLFPRVEIPVNFYIQPLNPTGLEPSISIGNLIISPNPSKSFVEFRFQESLKPRELLIYASNGKLMERYVIKNHILEINVQNYASGNYIAVVKYENNIEAHQFLVN